MTTESARESRGHSLVRSAPAILLIAGAALGLFAPLHGIAAPVVLMAVAVTLRFPRYVATLVTAAGATIVLVAPTLMHLAFPDNASIRAVEAPTVVAAWIVAVWLTAALRINDGRAAQVEIEQLAHAFEHAPAATAVVGRDGRLLHANQAFADLLGRPLVALPGRTLDDFLGETAWSSIRDDSRALLKGEVGHVSLERAFVRGDGRALWVSIYARLMKDAAGRGAYVILQAIDLSEQRLAQRALAISESRFRGIIELSGELVLVIDAAGSITYANPAVGRLVNRRPAALIGTPVIDFVHTADRKALEALIASARKQPRKGVSQRQLRLAQDGADVFLELHLTALEDTPGIEGTVLSGRVITDQVHAERAVRVSESKFSTIFHSSPDAIMILRNEDAAIIDFNAGFTKLLGYTREETIGEPLASLNLWADPKQRDSILEQLQRDKQVHYETKLIAKNGTVLDTEISVRYVEIQGELCVLCIGRDVTSRRKAEQALKESEEKFARIFANSPDGIVIVSLADGTVLDINEAFIKSSGYAYEEIVGRTLTELSVFADRKELDHAAEVTARSPGGSHLELTFVTKTGVKVPTLISTSVVELGGEKSLLCIAKDIRTQRDTEEKLRASESRFRSAFENAPMGMLLVQLDGTVFQANRFALEALGYPETELKGMHVARLLPASQRSNLKTIFGSLRSTGTAGKAEERPMLCRNGQEIWTNFHVVLQRSATGEPLYFIIQITDITEMRHNREQVERMAYYDGLTDLANRRLFSLRLEQAISHAVRSESFAALLYLDVDQFKRVNDTLGHEAGDEMLREVGRRLTDCVRREDTVARLGGDEFAILLFDVRHPGDAGTVAEKVLERLRLPITLAGHELVVTGSLGVTIVPTDSTEPNVLTKNADLAMYRAKERGRNNYQFYSEDMNTRAVARLKTENELRQGIEAEQFELYYQPKVRLEDGRILGVECLLRWHHPERGMMTPDKFIDIAEESGVIIELGAWVVNEACRAAERLSREVGFPIEIAVNISPRQFRDPKLVATIRRSLREAKLKPFQLELEITETMLMSDAEAASATVHRLHELDVKLAIDDFGTGYSSLNYLKRFPISTVKVDRSFVMDIPSNTDDMAITAAVIAMAHRLNLEVVAEGIETPAQLKFLGEHRCEYGQGYYFSKPVTFDAVLDLIQENRAKTAPRDASPIPPPPPPTKARLRPSSQP